MLHSIITFRYGEYCPSLDCMREWEDVLSKCLQLPLVPYNLKNMEDRRQMIGFQDIAILPLAKHIAAFAGNLNVIPIVIDCWRQDIATFLELYRDYKLVYVCSQEACRDIKSAGFGGVVHYLPMSVADTIRSHTSPEKTIDVIQYGRLNPLLDSFMRYFIQKFPKIEYVTRSAVGGEFRYQSSTKGMLGEFRTREQFLSLLSSAKVSLVSSPGMDGVANTGGYNPVSARFFESAAFYCKMIGRYPENDDFKTCRVNLVCTHVNTYEEFEEQLLAMLAKPFEVNNAFETFINMHMTSRRAYDIHSHVMQMHL